MHPLKFGWNSLTMLGIRMCGQVHGLNGMSMRLRCQPTLWHEMTRLPILLQPLMTTSNSSSRGMRQPIRGALQAVLKGIT